MYFTDAESLFRKLFGKVIVHCRHNRWEKKNLMVANPYISGDLLLPYPNCLKPEPIGVYFTKPGHYDKI